MLKALNEWAGRWLTRTLTLGLLAATAKVIWDNLWEAALAALTELNGWLGWALTAGTLLVITGTALRVFTGQHQKQAVRQ